MTPYPLILQPMLKPKVWGGRRLERLNKQLPSDTLIGESWELADLPEAVPDGRSSIANGPLAGITLRETIAAHHAAIMGHASLSDEGGFPLLLKYLDANENLSVQVHPDSRYVARHPGTHVKAEAWVILQADPGSVIYRGLKPQITRERLARDIRSGHVVEDLIAIEARAGDCHYLPSGTCHALGAGILLAEVQTPSDTTFRIYDWNRPASAARELHIEQALECIRFGVDEHVISDGWPRTAQRADPSPTLLGPVMQSDGTRCELLCRCEHFSIDRVAADPGGSPWYRSHVPGAPEAWMMLAGSLQIESHQGTTVRLSTGMTALLPAALQDSRMRIDEHSLWLRITLPRRTS